MRNVVLLMVAMCILTACGGDSSGGNSSTSANTPSISGQPATAINAGTTYDFVPTASDASGAALTFAIQHMPSWATFNTSTGELKGVPSAAEIGSYSGIVISVSDGDATSALPTFSINVTEMSAGSVTISWEPPTTNTNGTPLTNLAGYKIYYGTSPTSMTQSVQIANPGLASYVVENLSPATWYFSLVSYTSADVESPQTEPVSATVTS
jgi:putative Ig domain-containing protein